MKQSSIVNYFKNSLGELTQIVWPTKNQAVRLTIIVLIISFTAAFTLGLLDYLFNLGYTEILKLTA